MTLETVLIPTDGSDPAENAARYGFDLAEALGASVHVLSVADSSVATGAGYAGDSPSIRHQLRSRAQDRAQSLCDVALERGLDATAATREGIPAKEIVDYANEHSIDAIFIGTSGRGGVTRAIIGSVADKVVRTSSVPVVTVTPEAARRSEGTTVDSVLMPTDGSEPATEAIQQGLSIADQFEATVHFLSVVDETLSSRLAALLDDDDELSSQFSEQADSHLDAATAALEPTDREVVTANRDGNPADEIVSYADENDIDAIVMGTRGRGGFERLVLGSVTDNVVRTATVPVFTLRPHETTTGEDANSTDQ